MCNSLFQILKAHCSLHLYLHYLIAAMLLLPQWLHFSMQHHRKPPIISPKPQPNPNKKTKKRVVTVCGKIQISYFLLSSPPGILLRLK